MNNPSARGRLYLMRPSVVSHYSIGVCPLRVAGAHKKRDAGRASYLACALAHEEIGRLKMDETRLLWQRIAFRFIYM